MNSVSFGTSTQNHFTHTLTGAPVPDCPFLLGLDRPHRVVVLAKPVRVEVVRKPQRGTLLFLANLQHRVFRRVHLDAYVQSRADGLEFQVAACRDDGRGRDRRCQQAGNRERERERKRGVMVGLAGLTVHSPHSEFSAILSQYSSIGTSRKASKSSRWDLMWSEAIFRSPQWSTGLCEKPSALVL